MKRFITILTALALTACATVPHGAAYVPLADMQGKNPDQFARDVAECQVYAGQRMDAAQGAMVGAVAGALLGAFLAPRGYRNEVAGKIGALGALGGAAEANDTQETITKRCLAGRGYNVLN
jgi:outer membrane lipoprotein SlyB